MSFFRRAMPKLVCVLAALALGMFASGSDSYAAGSFTASSTASLSSTAANANANITTVLSIPINDYNFSSVINGTPGAAFVAPGPGSPAYQMGLYPSLGEVVGTLSSSPTLGFTGNPCLIVVTPSFVFLNATVDNSAANIIDAVPQAMTNPGSGGTLDNMWSDNGASVTGPGADAPWNLPWDSARATAEGLPASAGLSAAEQADGLPTQVQRYPSYLNTMFDPDGAAGVDPFAGAQPVQPLARYAGAVNVVGTSVTLNLVIFAPGVLANAGFGANHPFTLTGSLGYTSIAVLNDATVAASHGAISDFCSPLWTTALVYGMAKANPCKGAAGPPNCDTQTKISNPAAGADTLARYSHPRYNGGQSWISQHQSQRDADGDGTENPLDACAQAADTYNPRTGTPASEDDDADGLPDVCDPNDADGNFDADSDGWENSYDNCPLDSNPTQADSELSVAYGTTAPSGGPRGDDIGDPCDADDTVSGGAFLTSTSTSTFTITGGTTGDVDSDGDGFSNGDEARIGTSATSRCDVGFEAGPSQGWPPDFVSGGIFDSTDRVLIDDLNTFLAPIRRLDVNWYDDPNYNPRWDLSYDGGLFGGVLNVADINAMLGGAKGNPKMFNNRAFNGPRCTGIDGL